MEPIARIEAAIAELGAMHEPPAGWEARVLAQTGAVSRWRRLLRWKIAIPIAAAGAAAAIALATISPAPRELTLALAYQDTGAIVRGSSHTVGEILRATASGGHGHRAVWIYCEDRLVVACPGGRGCRSSGDATIAELALQTPGHYTIVALTANSPLSTSDGTLDGDVAGALRAGATVMNEDVSVR